MGNDFYYRGFVEACASRGLEKQAADDLYKQAQAWLQVGRGLGHAFNIARRAGGYVATAGRKAREAASAVGRAAVDVGHYTADLGRAGKAAIGAAGRSMATGFEQTVPAITRARWSSMLGLGRSNFLPRLGSSVASLRHPFTAAMGFVGRHPVVGTLGAMGIGAYLTNKANQASMMDREKAKVPALTPSEKAMYDRYDSGMNLPGLGLDPSYFTGTYTNSYM
jgi:hypothetical protein